jgi:cation diffusion facilitator family transporter
MNASREKDAGAETPACGCEAGPSLVGQKKLLGTLLAINAVMFVVELVAGVLGESSSLLADSLDMLADATVYGLALGAVGRSVTAKARAALVTGLFQVGLAAWVGWETAERFFGRGEPLGSVMMGVGAVALAANVTCFALLAKHRHGEIHLRASWLCSTNDVLANLGVITGGVLVAVTGSRLPDAVVGAVITALVLRGGVRILREAAAELRPDEKVIV